LPAAPQLRLEFMAKVRSRAGEKPRRLLQALVATVLIGTIAAEQGGCQVDGEC
jgi:hypothetical protein